jgi:hypothetical protein
MAPCSMGPDQECVSACLLRVVLAFVVSYVASVNITDNAASPVPPQNGSSDEECPQSRQQKPTQTVQLQDTVVTNHK